MKKLLWIAACAALIAGGPSLAANPAAGKEKSKTCAACHGPDGNSAAPDFPRLAGQNFDYLVKALSEYKAGERKNAIMAPLAGALSQRDIEDLAAYFSRQQGLVVKY
ncbi:MAG: cytochrome c [Burkholderiales bacterium]|nr:cytochrome c [Burkholderiales bacterium]